MVASIFWQTTPRKANVRNLILGAGLMARGALNDYLRQNDVEHVVVTDVSQDALDAIAVFAGNDERLETRRMDARDPAAVRDVMKDVDGAFCAIHYGFNVELTRAAIDTGTNLVDLGGNNDVVRAQLGLDEQARAAGVSIVPDCGLAPGMVALLVAWGLERFDWADAVHIRVGGLPLEPQEPLRYERLFSVEGLINEYVEPPLMLKDGKVVTGQALGDLEKLDLPAPIGTLEAFNTSGGTSTLIDTYGDRVSTLDYKTLRYPGHAHAMRWLMQLDLFSSDAVDVDGQQVVPRHLTSNRIAANVPLCERDRSVVVVDFASADGSQRHRLLIDDHYDETAGLTSMMRMTAFPAAIVSQFQCRGQVSTLGVQPQERTVDPTAFVDALAERNIEIAGIADAVTMN
jgi:lysine 6-dehydrogenase